MRPILCFLAAAAVLAGPLVIPPEAVGQTRRQMEERPFGGPPPKMRSAKPSSKKCKTAKKTCELKKEEVVGSNCTCPGTDTAQGKIVE